VVPAGSNGDDKLSEKYQDRHKTCGNGPTSCPRFSIPNCPRRHSRNCGHVHQEDWSDEQIPEKWSLVRLGKHVQNGRHRPQGCKSKRIEHELSEIGRPTQTRGPRHSFEEGFVQFEHSIQARVLYYRQDFIT